MKYGKLREARFLSRPNRFVAHCELDGAAAVCHVKNTGRCRELLIPGAKVYLQRAENPKRVTKYDLVLVEKGERLISIDSQLPNKLFREWAENGGVANLRLVKPESTFGNSRFDFYLETDVRRIFVEVKGVTLEEGGVAMFPDAPTLRGVKHLRELQRCVTEGYEAMAVFIIQMGGVHVLVPNERTHPEFGSALRAARDGGVEILALSCDVSTEGIVAKWPVEVDLFRQ